ncbi:hypothetical protein TetV_221 [Tetraselmis virus 1]|uniref:Uncharacterized protein n=1 Tax=Tetraselmis virus 1 TaxID=2060617 RepID=A0A2P0VN53_9VIRU|nr:hypothetical protein QJ968_gp221 [Tetraselmis virus 1]AUF82313.1 hypothetical protein TetV_221 [Tetraselmis virus 1]
MSNQYALIGETDDKITIDEFVSAKEQSVISEKSKDILEVMFSSYACFNSAIRSKQSYKKHPKKSYRSSKNNSNSSYNSIRTSRSVPLMLCNGTDKERSIRSDLNKITETNYTSIVRRFRFVDSPEDIVFAFKTALEKSYLEPQHNVLYVRLFGDMFHFMSTDCKSTATSIVNDQIPTSSSILEEALQPKTDPAQDYGQFCEICKIKRRIIGRSQVFAGMLRNDILSQYIDTTPIDIFNAHESAIKKIVIDYCEDEHKSKEIDTVSGVEVILESMEAFLEKHSSFHPKFRNTIDLMGGVDRFPSNKCKFKILDILGY